MANLAIRGHTTRGKEVIKVLEMFGGINKWDYLGDRRPCAYYINCEGIINYTSTIKGYNLQVFTLEDFLEKFPYKVGDKVKYINNVFCIKSSQWDSDKNTVIYYIDASWSAGYVVETDELQPYKEQETTINNLITEEDFNNTLEIEQEYLKLAERLIDQLAESTHWKCKDFDSQKMIALFLKKNTSMITKKENSTIVYMPKGYEFAGVVNGKVVFEKVEPKYPKTYEECYDVLGRSFLDDYIEGHKWELIMNFQKLLVCRDAYWKIAGEQMGLGKPWEPDWRNAYENHYTIVISKDNLKKGFNEYSNRILVFPTEGMRDVFYENFKDLIEECKELL